MSSLFALLRVAGNRRVQLQEQLFGRLNVIRKSLELAAHVVAIALLCDAKALVRH